MYQTCIYMSPYNESKFTFWYRMDYNQGHSIFEFYHVLVQIWFLTSKEEFVTKKINLGNKWLHEMQSNRKKSKLYGNTT